MISSLVSSESAWKICAARVMSSSVAVAMISIISIIIDGSRVCQLTYQEFLLCLGYMRYALISDIHANLPALEAVLEDIERNHPDAAIYHLGDLVGYAPWPNETVALLRERG